MTSRLAERLDQRKRFSVYPALALVLTILAGSHYRMRNLPQEEHVTVGDCARPHEA